ncbi:unnamed protein product [Durusdinium trenchii]|uniref:Uncharacterized protein n=1 Tax=Durusdinium trenchii TaxID=1381693 RepID=A0ABP0JGW4_9DINO
MFTEHAPEKPTSADVIEEKIKGVDEHVGSLTRDARKAQWEIDSLSLARDLAQIGKLLDLTVQNEHSKRTERILHLRNQNTIGASLVADWMSTNLAVHSGPMKDQVNLVDRFMVRSPGSPAIIWVDLMKAGRLTGGDVSDYVDLIGVALQKAGKMGCAIVVSPFLSSEKIPNRGSQGRLEAKFDAKSIWSEAITVRCSQPPSQRKVPIQFDGWVLLAESSRDENIFRSCQLIQDRSNRHEVAWQAEANYIVPVASKDTVPHASEGMRSLSDVQETAQFLAGEDLPRILLKSVLQKSELPDTCQSVSMINLTGYDGWLEKVCRRWRERETPQLSMKVLTLAKNLATAEFVEKSLALELMEDMMEWKAVNHSSLGAVRRYEPKPPVSPESDVDLANFPLQLVKVEYNMDSKLKGVEKYRITIPPNIRARYIDDAVYSTEWQNLMEDFDKKFGRGAPREEPRLALVPSVEETPEKKDNELDSEEPLSEDYEDLPPPSEEEKEDQTKASALEKPQDEQKQKTRKPALKKIVSTNKDQEKKAKEPKNKNQEHIPEDPAQMRARAFGLITDEKKKPGKTDGATRGSKRAVQFVEEEMKENEEQNEDSKVAAKDQRKQRGRPAKVLKQAKNTSEAGNKDPANKEASESGKNNAKNKNASASEAGKNAENKDASASEAGQNDAESKESETAKQDSMNKKPSEAGKNDAEDQDANEAAKLAAKAGQNQREGQGKERKHKQAKREDGCQGAETAQNGAKPKASRAKKARKNEDQANDSKEREETSANGEDKEEEHGDVHLGKGKGGALGRAGLRDVFWKHIAEAQSRLQSEKPDLSKKEVLKMEAVAKGDCE